MIVALIVLLIFLVAGFFILKMVLERPKTAPTTKPFKNSSTLDEAYAKEKGLWVCEYCETLNESAREKCAACGKGR